MAKIQIFYKRKKRIWELKDNSYAPLILISISLSLTFKVVTDADHRIRYVEPGLAGALHDQAVWEMSDLGKKVSQAGRLGQFFFLADAG